MSGNRNAAAPFGMKDKIGYMFGDFGNDFTFILSSSFMLKFYTDVMGVSAAVVGLLMMLARFIDAFTDITMGRIVDTAKPTKDGKFRPWIKRMCGPVAITSFLIYQSGFAGMPMAFKVGWMFVTYILWGSIFYTSINIPYGSMASVVSGDATERSQLSTFRTMGATLAGLVIGVGVPLVAFVTVDGKQVLSGSRITIIAGIFSVCAIICYLLCFKLVRERVEVKPTTQKVTAGEVIKSLVSNRALIAIIMAAILLLLAQLTMGSMNNYVFPNFYGSSKAISVISLLGSVVTLIICAPLTVPLTKKFGKKEVGVISCFVASAAFFIAFVVRPENVWVFVGFEILAYLGMGFFNMIIWAYITDVIDYAEIKNGRREDGTIYSVYSFARKIGQALSSGLSGALLTAIGYTAETAFDPAVTNGIYNITCLVTGGGFLLCGLVLLFIYPLNKKRVDENVAALALKNGNA